MVIRIKLLERRKISVPTTDTEVPPMYQPRRATAVKTQNKGAPRRKLITMKMMQKAAVIS
jgi:hypothetical protein